MGAEIDSTDLSGPNEQLLVKHFDSIVSGNDMKWQETEPTEGQFTYTTADQEVALAQANKMRVRGHNLVWSTGAQVPSWVFLEADGTTPLSAIEPADVQLLTARIQNHIKNLVQHFGTAVYVWDVVNEPLDPSAARLPGARAVLSGARPAIHRHRAAGGATVRAAGNAALHQRLQH